MLLYACWEVGKARVLLWSEFRADTQREQLQTETQAEGPRKASYLSENEKKSGEVLCTLGMRISESGACISEGQDESSWHLSFIPFDACLPHQISSKVEVMPHLPWILFLERNRPI